MVFSVFVFRSMVAILTASCRSSSCFESFVAISFSCLRCCLGYAASAVVFGSTM